MTTNQVLHVNIPTSIGHLEGILKPEPEPEGMPKFVSVICHPHPLGGGTMHNKVVFKVAQALQMANIPALRFNFRGVGHSTGTYDEGRGEMDDVRYALDFMSRRYPGIPAIIGGFSFGAYVGLRVACADDRVHAMVGLGVPARMFRDGEALQDCHKPKLFIHGTDDELAPYEQTQQWFEQVSAPKQLLTLQGADHFFKDHLPEVQTLVADFAASLSSKVGH
ncbi:alpha/beta hydrolase [Dictyobacter arantiisoli]|uniref:Alpha/beta hydrolase n=1 Tax=Dictyobacter arantiisoli TaxID=2014874 RepID=A0A5A5TCK2_9CHLR|nr:alpha/beta fold hydrolase [Dictyobacter arantiisoli]GCF09251.1 alpha/beta hydrolase [Dictyobacter arantiisoli]